MPSRRSGLDLLESARQFRLAQDTLGVVTWIWDLERDRVQWYGDIAQHLGLAPGSFSGRFQDYLRQVHPDDLARARSTFIACLKGLTPEYRSEERVLCPDGGERWLETYGRATYGPGGRAVRMTGVIKNITPRKRQEAALALAEKKFALTFESVATPIVLSRRGDGAIVAVNEAWTRVTGVPRERVLGHAAQGSGFWANLEQRDRIMREVDARGRAEGHLVDFLLPDGSKRIVQMSCVQLELEGEPHLLWSSIDVTNLRGAEQRERQAAAKYGALFDSNPEAIIITRLSDAVILEVNAAWERYARYRREDVIGRSARELGTWVDPADREAVVDLLERRGRVTNIETRFLRGDGATVEALLSAARIELDGEKCAIWSWRDVSDLRAAERLAAQSQRKYAALFEAAVDGMTIARTDSTILDANPAIGHMLGYSREELIGRKGTDFVDPEELASMPPRTDRGERWDRRERLLTRKDGSTVPVEVVAGPMPDGNVLAIVRDITERKRSETLLMHVARSVSAQVGEKFFHSLVDQLARELGADFVYIGELLPGAERMRSIAFVADGAPAAGVEYPVMGSMSAYALAARRTVTIAQGVAERFPGTEMRKHGVQAYVGTPLFGADGNALGVLTVAHRKPIEQGPLWSSMTEIFGARAAAEIERARADALVRQMNASLEQRVRERTEELEEANRDLDSYNYSVSHDLRQPLNAIAGFSELLRENLAGASAGEALEYTREIETNANRMEQMIAALLDFSRAGRGELARVAVDMRQEVDLVLQHLRRDHRVNASISVGELAPAQGDLVLLRQVWTNLIGNAIKYSAKASAPRIEISGARRGASIEYAVRDNGVGFDMRYADRLFGVFQRLPSAADFEGTGVGLAIVQRIVRRHGGQISAESSPGKGATIRFTLPG